MNYTLHVKIVKTVIAQGYRSVEPLSIHVPGSPARTWVYDKLLDKERFLSEKYLSKLTACLILRILPLSLAASPRRYAAQGGGENKGSFERRRSRRSKLPQKKIPPFPCLRGKGGRGIGGKLPNNLSYTP